ncbi:MAG: GNAT family N-acetyltransferase [Bacteroidales bacterium]|nr:GNAT family N-acetyltransferase [Bacteroidales bacterium]
MIGEKVFLRALELNDVQELYAFENDISIWNESETLMPYSTFALEQYVLDAVNSDIFASKQMRLAICQCSDGKIVGFIDLFNFSPKHLRAEVGVLIQKKHRKKGYAKEALQLLIDYSYKVLGLHQLACSINAENEGSIHLFEACNFVCTSRKKDWIRQNSTYTDELFYQLILK